MRRYAAVIFDWDGTIMDSTASIALSIQDACADLALPIPTLEQASWVIGLSFESALQHVVPTLSTEKMPLFFQSFRTYCLNRDSQIVLFEGILELLTYLRQQRVLLAVATGKNRAGLDRVLSGRQLHGYFDATRCADESSSKPDPTMLFDIMKYLNLEPDRVIMVGDTSHDIQMAHSAGVDSMAVSYGAHNDSLLKHAEPTTLVHSVQEMRQWLSGRVLNIKAQKELISPDVFKRL